MSIISRALKCTNFARYSILNSHKVKTTLTPKFFSISSRLDVHVQQPAPDWKGTAVLDYDFKGLSLTDYKGKYLAFFFYPLDFTFVCPTEIIAFSEKYEEFKKIDCELVACSTDSHFSHLAWTNTPRKSGDVGIIKYPLLSDFTKKITRDYGILIEQSDVALRGLFIIDTKSIVRQVTINDLPVGRSPDEVLRLVKAFQFNDKHGEVCPANWEPDKNAATIKPNPKTPKNILIKLTNRGRFDLRTCSRYQI